LRNKIFIFLIAKAISNIIINNKLQFSGSFGAVSICFGLKMGILSNSSTVVHNCKEDKQLSKGQTHY